MGVVEQDRLVRRYVEQRATLRGRMVSWIERWFLASKAFRTADADRFVEQVTPVAQAAQESTASFAWAFAAMMLADIADDRTAPEPVPAAEVTGRAIRDKDPAEVYRRPFVTIYTELSKGASLTQAVTAGENRAKTIALTDLERVDTLVAQRVMQADSRTPPYYRRELTGHENCGLCVIASTQRYKRGDLMPIHPGCDCVPRMIPPGQRVEHVLDQDLLDAAHDAIAARFGDEAVDAGGRAPDYTKLILVREHGELGPLLTVARHHFETDEEFLASRGLTPQERRERARRRA